MFEFSLKTIPDSLRKEIHEILSDVVEAIVEERKKEYDLPFMLSKSQMAKHIFNVSPQTLDAHIINRSDFPKMKVGERILFPRDLVIEWIRKNIDICSNLVKEKGETK
ncbi:helix-turn-helix domain-containing protein [Metabacillus halosaccharovorans]|uniref:helix-turn-helix domain-containing protein n=1 Tax=Metabacillus halosaccharovorans TaxID=930124 RepID=UPI000994D2E8|nr:helix-turn-helix domain-containing protein [Metabacillus halosaccharovorans]